MSLWANIKFFPEPTGELYGWLLATLFKIYLPTLISNLWELILSFELFLNESNLGCRSMYFSYSNVFLNVEYLLSLDKAC